jgi:hypothetical protein
MQRRQGDAKTKARIVLQGLQGKPVAESCHEHQSRQSLYDQGRDPFLAHVDKAFEVHQHARTEAHLERENAKRKRLVGELLLERKKSDARLGGHGGGRSGCSSETRLCSPASRRSRLSIRSGAIAGSGRICASLRSEPPTRNAVCGCCARTLAWSGLICGCKRRGRQPGTHPDRRDPTSGGAAT